jgi:hypothetical protein
MHLTTKSRGAALALAAVTLAACPGPDEPALTKRQRAARIVSVAKEEIAKGNYSGATGDCLRAEAIDDTYDEAKYCVFVAQSGALVNSVGSIVGLVVGQLKAPAYETQAISVKPIVSSILEDVEAEMRYLDAYAYKLTAMENPHFQIKSFPLSLDPKDLLSLLDTDRLEIKGEIAFDLGGTWDKSEVQAVGAGVNAVQALLDYLLAHKLVLASTDISFDTTGSVAQFLSDNPNMLAPDPKDASRIAGDGDKHKGFKNDVLAALSYLVGRDADLALVAPKNDGLKAAIKASAAEAATYPDQVVRWIDGDGDGIPEKLGMPAVNAIKDKVLADGKPLIEGDTFDNPLKPSAWEAFIKVGKEVRANVESGGGKPIAAKEALVALVDSLKKSDSTTRLLLKEVPDVAAFDPGTFVKAPKYLSELVPYYYFYATAATPGTQYIDLAIETEVYDGAANYLNRHGQRHGANQTADFAHFGYPANDVFSASYTVSAYQFTDFASAAPAVAADGVTATVKTPRLWYFAMQDPSLGGMLYGDAEFNGDGTGGQYQKLDNFKLWKGLNKLLKYYCIDTTDFALEMFDDTYAKYTNNKIADCNQSL